MDTSYAEAVKASLLREHDVLLIAGPPGSGKTTLARLIAASIPGKVQECAAEDLRRHFKPMLAGSPDVRIVDGVNLRRDSLRLKRLAVSSTVVIDLQDMEQVTVSAPRFVIAVLDNSVHVETLRLTHLRRPK